MMRCRIVWYDAVCCVVEWNGVVWYEIVCYGIILYPSASLVPRRFFVKRILYLIQCCMYRSVPKFGNNSVFSYKS